MRAFYFLIVDKTNMENSSARHFSSIISRMPRRDGQRRRNIGISFKSRRREQYLRTANKNRL